MSILKERLNGFFARHPILLQVLFWSVPAILFGATLRLMFLHYSPYAYWGSDSRSYYNFAYKLLTAGYLSLDEKRRFLYPILMVPVSLLPGAPLRWGAILQHAFGIACLLPLAYIVRKSFYHWRLWIIPVTVLYAGLPVILWYEHELLGETISFGLILWAFAGWVAWVGEERIHRARSLFWWFLVPFALFILTKPSGRFYWPGICAGLLLIRAWKRLGLKQGAAIAVLMIVTLFVGSKKQGAWLFYVASFPLTQLDSPLHAQYKAQIRDLVEPLQNRLDQYYLEDSGPFQFLDTPNKYPDKTFWCALKGNDTLRTRIYMDLALEAVRARPAEFIKLGLSRVVASANISEFKESRFEPDYAPRRIGEQYMRLVENPTKGQQSSLAFALGIPKRGPLPDLQEIERRLSPAPESWTSSTLNAWVGAFETSSELVRLPDKTTPGGRSIYNSRLTALGWWMICGIVLSLLPAYRNTLGCWALAGIGYLLTFFLISQPNPRYFAPAWPVLVVLAAIPADILLRLAQTYLFGNRRTTNPSGPILDAAGCTERKESMVMSGAVSPNPPERAQQDQ